MQEDLCINKYQCRREIKNKMIYIYIYMIWLFWSRAGIAKFYFILLWSLFPDLQTDKNIGTNEYDIWNNASRFLMSGNHIHYNDVIMSAMASQMTSLMIVYSSVYSGTDQRKYQSSASLAFVRGIHRWPVNSPHKGPVTRKMFPFDDVIMVICISFTGWRMSVMYHALMFSVVSTFRWVRREYRSIQVWDT